MSEMLKRHRRTKIQANAPLTMTVVMITVGIVCEALVVSSLRWIAPSKPSANQSVGQSCVTGEVGAKS